MDIRATHYNIRELTERVYESDLSEQSLPSILHFAPSIRIQPIKVGGEDYWPKAHVEAWIKVFAQETPASTKPNLIDSCADYIITVLNGQGIMVPEHDRRKYIAQLSNRLIDIVVPEDELPTPEKILFRALCDVLDKLQSTVLEMPPKEAYPVFKAVDVARTALFAYADKVELKSRQVCWNKPDKDGKPKHTDECKDHPAVRRTSYMEIHHLIGTSGCSKEEPYWTWMVMGVIETPRGKLVVNPGDWIVEPLKGYYQVLTDEQFKALYQ